MIRFLNILLACAAEPWALERGKLIEVRDFVLRKAGEPAGAPRPRAIDPNWPECDPNDPDPDNPNCDEFMKARGPAVQFWAADANGIMARVTQRAEQRAAQSDGVVAVLPVYGVLSQRMNMMQEFSGGTSTQQLAMMFRALLADPGTSAIVFDFDSPGGTVSGIQELGQEIYDSRGVKPIVAQVNSMAASAAYWLACQCDEIVVTPSGQAGSIGIYTIHEDVSKMLDNEGIATTMISAGKYKTEGSPYGPLSEDAVAAIQARVDQSYNAFVEAVARGRGNNITPAVVNDRFGQGRMFGADELVARRMADQVATLEQTIERFSAGVSFNPVAKAARDARAQRSQAADTLITKLKAGDQPSPRELEHGLKGLVGLTNAEAERAVRQCFKGIAQGDPGKPTEPAFTSADTADLRSRLGDLRQILKP